MTNEEERPVNWSKALYGHLGADKLQLCEEIIQIALKIDDLRSSIAILDLAKARLNLLVTEGCVPFR